MEEEVIKEEGDQRHVFPELVFFSAALGLRWCVGSSPVAAIGGGCLAAAHGPLPQGPLLLPSADSRAHRLSRRGS